MLVFLHFKVVLSSPECVCGSSHYTVLVMGVVGTLQLNKNGTLMLVFTCSALIIDFIFLSSLVT